MIKEEIIQKLKDLPKKYGLNIFILFGSFALGTNKENSDVDLAFFPKKELSVKDENLLFEEIISILSFEKVDLVNLNTHFSHFLRNEIFSKGVCIYEEKKGLFNNLKVKAWMDFIDYNKYYLVQKEILDKKVALL